MCDRQTAGGGFDSNCDLIFLLCYKPVRLPNREISDRWSNRPKMCFSKIFLIHVDDMSVDMLCSDFRDFMAKSVGAVSKNVFLKISLKVALYGTDSC